MTLYINRTQKVKDQYAAWYFAIRSLGHTNVGKSLLQVSGLTDDILRLSIYCKMFHLTVTKMCQTKKQARNDWKGTRDCPR